MYLEIFYGADEMNSIRIQTVGYDNIVPTNHR